MEIYAQAFRELFKNCGVTYSLTTGSNSNGGLNYIVEIDAFTAEEPIVFLVSKEQYETLQKAKEQLSDE